MRFPFSELLAPHRLSLRVRHLVSDPWRVRSSRAETFLHRAWTLEDEFPQNSIYATLACFDVRGRRTADVLRGARPREQWVLTFAFAAMVHPGALGLTGTVAAWNGHLRQHGSLAESGVAGRQALPSML